MAGRQQWRQMRKLQTSQLNFDCQDRRDCQRGLEFECSCGTAALGGVLDFSPCADSRLFALIHGQKVLICTANNQVRFKPRKISLTFSCSPAFPQVLGLLLILTLFFQFLCLLCSSAFQVLLLLGFWLRLRCDVNIPPYAPRIFIGETRSNM